MKLSSSPAFKSALTLKVQMLSLNGRAVVEVLPDSGADVCVRGLTLLKQLGEHQDNLLSSSVTLRAVNNTTIKPMGKLPIIIKLGSHNYTDTFHIFPNVTITLLLWKAARGLTILTKNYLNPAPTTTLRLAATTISQPSSPLDVQHEFPTVFDGQIKTMESKKFRIILTEDAQLFCVDAPRTVQFAFRDKLKAELELLQEQGIIAPVTEPTNWCFPIVVTPKKDSEKIRICVDFTRLNKFAKREKYQSATPAQAVADITAQNATIFTKFDAVKGYHKCPLEEESQILMTFITPFSKFKFLCAPYGISSISEHHNRRMDEAFSGLTGYCIIDNIVIYDSDPNQHTDHVQQFLQRCAERNITLNPDKWEFAKEHVSFAELKLSTKGYSIDESITTAITQFPSPVNRTNLCAFVGLANQLSTSTSALADFLTPLRPLLSTNNEFIWTSEHNTAFTTAKTARPYQPPRPYHTLTLPNPPTWAQMLVVTDSGLSYSKRIMTTGHLYKQAIDSSLTPNPDKLL